MSTLRFFFVLLAILLAVRYYNGNERAKQQAVAAYEQKAARAKADKRYEEIRTLADQQKALRESTDELIEMRERMPALERAAEEERNRPPWKKAVYALLNL